MEHSKSTTISFRGEGTQLDLRILGFEHEHATNKLDASWLLAQSEFRREGILFGNRFSLTARELSEFGRELDALEGAMSGRAILETLEGDVKLEVTTRRLGGFSISGFLVQGGATKCRLEFVFSGDFEALSRSIANVRAAQQKWSQRPRLNSSRPTS